MNILLCIGYDGTYFHGSQKQKKERTVQQEIEAAIETLVLVRPTLYFSGRTDSGVHAERQYVNFKLDYCRIPVARVSLALNSILPRDIRVYWSKEVPDDFHARYSAKSKAYYYRIALLPIVPPTLRHHCFNFRAQEDFYKKLNWPQVQEDLNQVVGTHDFTAFSTVNAGIPHRVRTVAHATMVFETEHIKRIYIVANGFLWKMIRSIVGTCMDRAYSRYKDKNCALPSIREIIEKRDRKCVGTTAPPQGLFLFDVEYNEKYGIPHRLGRITDI